ncbi:MAG: hypothetical protein MZU97_08535 [Bacillus subtilis]|nr:hypothetical protein [Bacillus subtilis]
MLVERRSQGDDQDACGAPSEHPFARSSPRGDRPRTGRRPDASERSVPRDGRLCPARTTRDLAEDPFLPRRIGHGTKNPASHRQTAPPHRRHRESPWRKLRGRLLERHPPAHPGTQARRTPRVPS